MKPVAAGSSSSVFNVSNQIKGPSSKVTKPNKSKSASSEKTEYKVREFKLDIHDPEATVEDLKEFLFEKYDLKPGRKNTDQRIEVIYQGKIQSGETLLNEIKEGTIQVLIR